MSIFYALKSDSLSFKMFCMYFAVSEIESSLEGTQNSIHCIGNLFAKLTSSCYCNGTRTHNYLVRKLTLNHLAKQKKKKKKKKKKNYNQMHRTDKYSQHSSIIWPVWLNG